MESSLFFYFSPSLNERRAGNGSSWTRVPIALSSSTFHVRWVHVLHIWLNVCLYLAESNDYRIEGKDVSSRLQKNTTYFDGVHQIPVLLEKSLLS